MFYFHSNILYFWLHFHTEVVEKAKEGYESSVSDLEEDDAVIYNTLNPDTNSSTTGTYSDYSNRYQIILQPVKPVFATYYFVSDKENNTNHFYF